MDLNRTSKKNIINYNEINVETIPKRKRRKTFFLGKDDFITFDLIKEVEIF